MLPTYNLFNFNLAPIGPLVFPGSTAVGSSATTPSSQVNSNPKPSRFPAPVTGGPRTTDSRAPSVGEDGSVTFYGLGASRTYPANQVTRDQDGNYSLVTPPNSPTASTTPSQTPATTPAAPSQTSYQPSTPNDVSNDLDRFRQARNMFGRR